jgi:2-methylcitrate dehydratase PrpD
MSQAGLTAELAAFVAGTRRAAIPAEALVTARRAFVDTVGVMLAGWPELATARVEASRPNGDEAVPLLGERRLSVQDAALVNGVAGHVLDYDDVASHGHPSVVIIPALLAEAQRTGASGRDALEAYVIGFEAWAELGVREPDPYHLHSWHPTAMLGAVAGAAAVAALNRLDAARTQHALAISASLASGVIANFGTHAKPLQAGRAAANAVEAVRLAMAGVEGAAAALESPHGLLRGISPGGRVDLSSPVTAGERWRLLEQGLSVKRYPVCYASHRAVDGVIALATAENLAAGEVASVTVKLGPSQAATLRYAHPQTGLEAKLSLTHNVACALLERALGFGQLTDAYVRRAEVEALYGLTRYEVQDEECPDQPGMALHDQVTIETRDGRRLDSGPIRYARGHARAPLSDAELELKFLDCARHGGVADGAAWLERLRSLETVNRLDLFKPA